MSLKLAKLSITLTGGVGSGSGSAVFSPCPTGYLEELYLDYGQTSATTNVTVIDGPMSTPILRVSNNQTDGAYYPRATAVGVAGGSYGSTGAVPIAIVSPFTVSVTGGNDATMTVYAKVQTL